MATAQRAYQAACPHCGAPVAFASAASASAVCSYCRSTLVRDGDALKRIGVSAELFDDHSPLQLGAGGMAQGLAFTLVGRVQMGYDGGTWNEWHALFANGRSAWLSEDNGAYVLAFDGPLPADAPALDSLRAGQRVVVDRRGWDVASVQRAHVIAAQGELPRPPRLQGDFRVIDLRNAQGEVATLDASDPAATGWASGRAVLLADLKMTGLAEASEKTLTARGVSCPNCGDALTVTLASTQSITCGQCNAVVDVSAGVGGELAHYAQNNSGDGGLEPQIPLGRSGTLALGGAAAPWQVVGYQERCDIPQGGDDETTFWREYLLYNRQLGFAFLVDSEDGWSWVRPSTGAPQVRGDTASLNGTTYRQRWAYGARVTWVQGEFYWRVQRGERAQVTDYEAGTKRLSREQTGNEVVWSAGQTLDAAVVARAFGLDAAPGAGPGAGLDRGVPPALQRDAAPSGLGQLGTFKAVLILVLIFGFLIFASQCSENDCSDEQRAFGTQSLEYRQCLGQRGSGRVSGGGGGSYGGSYGGWSSGGGGHK